MITNILSRLQVLYVSRVLLLAIENFRLCSQDELVSTPPTSNGTANGVVTDFSHVQNSALRAVAQSTSTSSSERKRPHDETDDVATPRSGETREDETPAKKKQRHDGAQSIDTSATHTSVASVSPADCNFDANSNCSSTVDDMKRIFVGDNRIFPLTIQMEQRMILQYLQSVSEFTDHLSILVDNGALRVIMQYLNTEKYADIRVLFEALYCLGTMLIHLRLAWDFVNVNGLRKLIAVNRHSLAAAAVCVCLHHVSWRQDAILFLACSCAHS